MVSLSAPGGTVARHLVESESESECAAGEPPSQLSQDRSADLDDSRKRRWLSEHSTTSPAPNVPHSSSEPLPSSIPPARPPTAAALGCSDAHSVKAARQQPLDPVRSDGTKDDSALNESLCSLLSYIPGPMGLMDVRKAAAASRIDASGLGASSVPRPRKRKAEDEIAARVSGLPSPATLPQTERPALSKATAATGEATYLAAHEVAATDGGSRSTWSAWTWRPWRSWR